MTDLKSFREKPQNTEALTNFLLSEPGRELTEILRMIRASMTSDKGLSEGRICGRHDVFQSLDDLFFIGTQPLEPKKTPMSAKGGNIKPHKSVLP